MAVLYSELPFRITEILLPYENKDKFAAYLNKTGTHGFHPNAELVAKVVGGYFEGKAVSVPWKWMEMGDLTALQQITLKHVADIPYGELRSYKEIAEKIGKPKASRFVGTSVAKNPFPILIPCHRVIRSSGIIGRFGGGTEMKRQLILMEKNFLANGGGLL